MSTDELSSFSPKVTITVEQGMDPDDKDKCLYIVRKTKNNIDIKLGQVLSPKQIQYLINQGVNVKVVSVFPHPVRS